VVLNKDILLLAQKKCTQLFSPKIITNSLSQLNNIDKNDLNKIDYNNSSYILSILNHLKKEILVNPDDTYIQKVSHQIDSKTTLTLLGVGAIDKFIVEINKEK
jgi:hypothetical protein